MSFKYVLIFVFLHLDWDRLTQKLRNWIKISVHQSKHFCRFGENACPTLLEGCYVIELLKTESSCCSRKGDVKNEWQSCLKWEYNYTCSLNILLALLGVFCIKFLAAGTSGCLTDSNWQSTGENLSATLQVVWVIQDHGDKDTLCVGTHLMGAKLQKSS